MIDGRIITGVIGFGGVALGAAGTVMIYAKKQKKSNAHHFKEGILVGKNRVNEKAHNIIKVQKERDRLMLLGIKIGVFVGERDSFISPEILVEIEKYCLFINDNPTTPKFLKEEFQRIINSKISFNEINDEMDSFLEGKSRGERLKTISFFSRIVTAVMNADNEANLKHSIFLTLLLCKIHLNYVKQT